MKTTRIKTRILAAGFLLLGSLLPAAVPANAEVACLDAAEGLRRVCPRVPAADNACGGWRAFETAYCLADQAGPAKEFLNTPYIQFEQPGTGELEIYRKLPVLPRELLNSDDTRETARLLVQRHFLQRELPRTSAAHLDDPQFSLFEDTKVVMEVPARLLGKIRRGGFRNTHQTGTSSAFLDREWRVRRESLFFRLRFTDADRLNDNAMELLPKYAYVVPKQGIPRLGPGKLRGYADTLVIFKDSVKQRATLTRGDTLFGTGGWGLLDVTDKAGFSPPFTFYALNFETPAWGLGSLETHGEYLEAQIWGKLTFQEVDYVIAGCYSKLSDAELKKIRGDLPDDVPLYDCAPGWSPEANQFIPGRRIE